MPRPIKYAVWDGEPVKKVFATLPLDDVNFLNTTYGLDTTNGVLLSFSNTLGKAMADLRQMKEGK
jgi:hypothetical protein